MTHPYVPSNAIPEDKQNGRESDSIGREDVAIEISDGPMPDEGSKSHFFKMRLVIFVVAVLGIYFTKEQVLPGKAPQCLIDHVMEFLGGVNDLIIQNPDTWGRYLKIASQIPIDIIFLVQFINWVFNGKSVRFLVTLAVFYAVRGFTMSYFLFGYPTGFNWSDPGFPSIVVPYGDNPDFFFSGHCGFLIINGVEFWNLGLKKIAVVTHLFIIFEAFVLISHRVHFSIDITTGLVYGHYISIIIRYYSNDIDGFLLRIWNKIIGANPEKVSLKVTESS